MVNTTITATDFKNRVGEFQDKALTGPVLITKNGREHTVLISAAEYRSLQERANRHLSVASGSAQR